MVKSIAIGIVFIATCAVTLFLIYVVSDWVRMIRHQKATRRAKGDNFGQWQYPQDRRPGEPRTH